MNDMPDYLHGGCRLSSDIHSGLIFLKCAFTRAITPRGRSFCTPDTGNELNEALSSRVSQSLAATAATVRQNGW